MTAVALQQHAPHRQQYTPRQSPHSSNMPSPHQSRSQNHTSNGPAQAAQHQAPSAPAPNGTSNTTYSRSTFSNDPPRNVNGNGIGLYAGQKAFDERGLNTTNGTSAAADPGRDRRLSLQTRPTTAPGVVVESSQDESEMERPKRRPKSLLQRSKSDYGPRLEDMEDPDEGIQDWGARHGFEDHYASEEYVSMLANVSCAFHRVLELYLLWSSFPSTFLPSSCGTFWGLLSLIAFPDKKSWQNT